MIWVGPILVMNVLIRVRDLISKRGGSSVPMEAETGVMQP